MDTFFLQILPTFIGGIITAGIGWLLEKRRENARLERGQKLLSQGICDDLDYSLSLYEKVSEEWEKTKTVWFSTLNEIKESRYTYQNNKDWITIFDNPEKRKKIFRYYLRSGEVINSLEYQQRRKYEIETKYNLLVTDIKKKNSNISEEEAKKVAINLMPNENNEYEGLLKSVPELILKLQHFKQEAEVLLKFLKN